MVNDTTSKTLWDLEGWTPDYTHKTASGGNYMLLSNIESTQIATVRMKDEIVMLIVDIEKREFIYKNQESNFVKNILPGFSEEETKTLIDNLIEEWRELLQ